MLYILLFVIFVIKMDIITTFQDHKTFLDYVCENGHIYMLKVLIKTGADIHKEHGVSTTIITWNQTYFYIFVINIILTIV